MHKLMQASSRCIMSFLSSRSISCIFFHIHLHHLCGISKEVVSCKATPVWVLHTVMLVHPLKIILDQFHTRDHKKHWMAYLTWRLRPAAIVDADSLETTNTPRGTPAVADSTLSIKVRQLNCGIHEYVLPVQLFGVHACGHEPWLGCIELKWVAVYNIVLFCLTFGCSFFIYMMWSIDTLNECLSYLLSMLFMYALTSFSRWSNTPNC